MAGKTALVFLAEGAEEMETVIVVDVLRRAKIAVTLASLTDNLTVECSRQVKMVADCPLAHVKDQLFDAVVLPGGAKGRDNLCNSSEVGDILKKHEEQGKIVAAVCASSTVFLKFDIGKGKSVTSYPAFRSELENDYKYSEDRVVVDGNLVSSRGPGTSFEFAFKLAELLVDKEMADQLKSQTLALTA